MYRRTHAITKRIMAYFLIYTITLFDTLSFTFGLTSVVLFIIYGHIMLKDFGYLTDEQKQEQKKLSWMWKVALTCLLLSTFIPSSRQAAFIYMAPKILEDDNFRETFKNFPEIVRLGTEYLKQTLEVK